MILCPAKYFAIDHLIFICLHSLASRWLSLMLLFYQSLGVKLFEQARTESGAKTRRASSRPGVPKPYFTLNPSIRQACIPPR